MKVRLIPETAFEEKLIRDFQGVCSILRLSQSEMMTLLIRKYLKTLEMIVYESTSGRKKKLKSEYEVITDDM